MITPRRIEGGITGDRLHRRDIYVESVARPSFTT
jgi:hypothetical protein